MNRSLIALVLVSAAATRAHAQGSPMQVGEVVEGAGIKVGEGTVLHPVLGVETGVVNNVFYEDSDTVSSGLLRVIGQLAVGSLPSERMQPPSAEAAELQNFGDIAFRADLEAQYQEYLSTNDNVQAQRDVQLSMAAQMLIHPKRTWQVGINDEFRREVRPVNFESSQNTDRDINRAGIMVRYRPLGRTLSGLLRYSNTIDLFEDPDQRFADRMSNVFTAMGAWQWLPMTRLHLETSFGWVGGVGSRSTRPSSTPLRITAGIASALTVKTTALAHVGFAKGFYSTGPDFTNVTGGLQLTYRYSEQARMAVLYNYDFEDSINANYFTDHAVKFRIEHWWYNLAVAAAAELYFRTYHGVIPEVMGSSTDRSDIIFSVPFDASYRLKNWIALTLEYRLSLDQTDFRYTTMTGGTPDDPSYIRQSLMVGARAAY